MRWNSEDFNSRYVLILVLSILLLAAYVCAVVLLDKEDQSREIATNAPPLPIDVNLNGHANTAPVKEGASSN